MTLEVSSPQHWLNDHEGFTYLVDPVENTPLRGFNLDKPSAKAPHMFHDDMDTHDGLGTWARAADNAENIFDVGILLTDPSRPDGLGDTGQLRELVNSYDMIAHVSTRGVVHSIRQHIAVHGDPGRGGIIPGQWLGRDASHPEYTAQLQAALAGSPKKSFSADPSLQSGIAVPSTRLVQQIRDEVFNLTDLQEHDIHNPEDMVTFTDIVHVNSLGHLIVANAGLRMDLAVEEDGIYPNSALLIVPGELSHRIDQQTAARGLNTQEEHQETQVYIADQRVAEDEYFQFYAGALADGRIPLPQ